MVRLDASQPMPASLAGAVIALGNFDGFHRGHQHVVGAAVDWARAEGRPAIVATFDPHPVRFFAPDAAPFRLTTLDQREELFAAAGADAMLVFAFDAALAATTAEDFVQVLLARHLAAGAVVTGEDFTFGKGRRGNVGLLTDLGRECGLAARAITPVSD
ncbi:MAG TPA: bifunctional riboflavin kinase/FMN adenylyltransferase, partial [Novosphingobium sp.]|nr:bifunctional riboflavin kinase/FMN adenylyltransferase [Novosphingobium sp.]